MRLPLLTVALILFVFPASSEAVISSSILETMRCQRTPSAGALLSRMADEGLISRKASRTYDSVSMFALRAPIKVDGLSVVAVFGFDETKDFKFTRSPGTSPGATFGVVTTDGLYTVDQWRKRVNPALSLDDGNSGIAGAKELACDSFIAPH